MSKMDAAQELNHHTEEESLIVEASVEPADPLELPNKSGSMDIATEVSVSFPRQPSPRKQKYSEEFLQTILEQVRSGAMTLYHAKKHYGVPRATLQYRLKAEFRKALRPDARCLLTEKEEQQMVVRLQFQERSGVPITRPFIVNEVNRFLKGRRKPPGRRWLDNFLQRHPQIPVTAVQAVPSMAQTPTISPTISPTITPTMDSIPADPIEPKKLKKYPEKFLQSMAEKIRNGSISLNQAQTIYGISRQALQYRMSRQLKNRSKLSTRSSKTQLTREEELQIVGMFQEQINNGFIVMRERVITQVRHWFKGRQKIIDTQWLNGFERRYPDLFQNTEPTVTVITAPPVSPAESPLKINPAKIDVESSDCQGNSSGIDSTPANPIEFSADITSKANSSHRSVVSKKEDRKSGSSLNQRYTEAFLQSVLAKIRNGTMTQYAASKYSGIPRATLSYRLSGACRNKLTPGPFTLLNKEEELQIVDWLQDMDRKGFTITRKQLRFKASCFQHFNQKVPSKHWMQAFMQRHPQLCVHPSQFTKTESQQAIRAWFQTMEEYFMEHDLADALKDPARVLIGDETGFCTTYAPTGFLVSKVTKRVPATRGATQNVTVLFSFAADGTVFPPNVIVCSKLPIAKTIQSFPEDWIIGNTVSGLLDATNFTNYIQQTLVPRLVSKGVKFPVIYFVDDHQSQAAFESADTCAKLGIILVALFPGASQILQPSDMAIFGPLKHSWDQKLKSWRSKSKPHRLPMASFSHLLRSAAKSAFDTSSIVNTFRNCGLYPFRPSTAYYSQCISKYKTSSDTSGEGMTLIPTAAVQAALKMIGEEKLALYKAGDQTNFSHEDRALLFIYEHILTVGQASTNIVADRFESSHQPSEADEQHHSASDPDELEYSSDDGSQVITEDTTMEESCHEPKMFCCVQDCCNPHQKWTTEFPHDDELQARWKAAIQFGTGKRLPDETAMNGALVCNMHFVFQSSPESLDEYREPSLFIRNNVLVEVASCRLCFRFDLTDNMLDMEDCLRQGDLPHLMVSRYNRQLRSSKERKEDRYFCKQCTARASITDAFEKEICKAARKYMKLIEKMANHTIAMKSTGPLPREEIADTFVKKESENLIDEKSNDADEKVGKCSTPLTNEGFNMSTSSSLPLARDEFAGVFVKNTPEEIIIKEEPPPDSEIYEVEILDEECIKEEPQLSEPADMSDAVQPAPDENLTEPMYKNTRWSKCYICDTIMASKISLSRHLLINHDSGDSLHCEKCSLHFNDTIHFNRHLATHDEICHKTFTTPSGLKQHMLCNGIGPLYCQSCKKWYTNKSDLVSHKRECAAKKVKKWQQQTNPQNPHKSQLPNGQPLASRINAQKKREPTCNVCQVSFKQSKEIVTHFIHVHPDFNLDYFPCSECEEVYFGQDPLLVHKNCHTDKYACALCGKRHNSTTELDHHRRSRHDLHPERNSLWESMEEKHQRKALNQPALQASNSPDVEI